jgi:NADP-dependent 3-hydroxy acid dehydrogenase YdfG
MKSVLITGATSGFGLAMAWKFARAGWNVTLCGRRKERLLRIRDEIEKTTKQEDVKLLEFDVRDRHQTIEVLVGYATWEKGLNLLINNAGLAAGLSTIDEGEIDDWDVMIDTNVKGLLYTTRALLPLLKKTAAGGQSAHIINIGSTAAKTVYKNGNVYCATKAAVDTLSQAMRVDLLPHGIKVTAIHPGAAETEFSLVRYKGDEARAAKVYDGFTPLSAQDVADVAFYCATLPAHLCINDLTMTTLTQANGVYNIKTAEACQPAILDEQTSTILTFSCHPIALSYYVLLFTLKIACATARLTEWGFWTTGNTRFIRSRPRRGYRELLHIQAAYEELGIQMPVVELNSRYLRPARYDDLLTVTTHCASCPTGSSVKFHVEIFTRRRAAEPGLSRLFSLIPQPVARRGLHPELRSRLEPFLALRRMSNHTATIITHRDELSFRTTLETNARG